MYKVTTHVLHDIIIPNDANEFITRMLYKDMY